MTNEKRDEEFEVVWSGGPGLIPDRETKVVGIWTPPRRIYNWSGKYTGKWKPKAKVDEVQPVIDTFGEGN